MTSCPIVVSDILLGVPVALLVIAILRLAIVANKGKLL